MKKFICCLLSALTIGACFFFGCNVTSSTSGSESGVDNDKVPTALTLAQQLAKIDKNYDRAVYVTEGDKYNLKKQYEYEELLQGTPTYQTEATSFMVTATGVIMANSVDDYVSEELTVVLSEEKTEKVIVHVFDREKYGSKYSTVDLGALYGKSVMFFGDSITHNWARYPSGNMESDNGSTHLGYNHIPLLNESCKFSKIVNAAWSGGTMSYVPSSTERFTYKSFPGSVDAHAEDIKTADVIFVWYGTNDLTEQYPLGEETDTMTTDETTDYGFYAGLNYGLDKIHQLNPDANVIVMTIMVRDPINLGKIKITDYNAALTTGAENHNAKVLNTYKLFYMKDLKTNFSDSLHPNETGYKVITDYILNDNKTLKR